ncbi:hypothetical protein [Parageobacillus thermoglucosidasius]|uniref:Mobile element protein n=1 Tax=Parageobacillus thermoglucosidasius TaxID=1426 RepID=A0A1B7KSG6_PARTM|nr:hypothetical protein [Parageobacillus thermoglucosidasius]OAT73013.1 hypothetical protein A7K69_19390 [Parageobacillus thermoglucosidasius]
MRQRDNPLVKTNPMHVKRSKRLDDNFPIMRDAKDVLVIVQLMKDSRFSYPCIFKGMEVELRVRQRFDPDSRKSRSGSESVDSLVRSVLSGVMVKISLF